jgi:hypothetical protein
MNACSKRFFKASIVSSLFSKKGALNSSFLFQLPNASALTEVLGFLWTGYWTTGRSMTSSEESLSDDSDSSPVDRSSVLIFYSSINRGTSLLRNSSSARSFKLTEGRFPWRSAK